MSERDTKRKFEDEGEDDSEDEWIGPRPEEAAPEPKPKKVKVLEHEQIYLDNLPCAEYYEKSYMHGTLSHM